MPGLRWTDVSEYSDGVAANKGYRGIPLPGAGDCGPEKSTFGCLSSRQITPCDVVVFSVPARLVGLVAATFARARA